MDTPIVALTKTLTDGRTAIVTISGGATHARVDGQDFGNHMGPHHAVRRRPGIPDAAVAAIGRLLLTQDEADQIKAAWDEMQAQRRLEPQAVRDRLVRAVIWAQQEWSATRAKRMDDGDWADPFALDAANEAKIDAARAELAAFDAKHPELVTQLAAERAESTDRAMRQ